MSTTENAAEIPESQSSVTDRLTVHGIELLSIHERRCLSRICSTRAVDADGQAIQGTHTAPNNPIRPTERSKLPLHLRQRVFIFKREHKREVLIHRLVHLTARNESNSDHGNLPSERWHRTLILRCRAGQ
jgi:hypothetical protein